MAVSWQPVEIASSIHKKAASVLFPGDSQGLRKLGRIVAAKDLNGVYKIVLRITTVPFVLKQIAGLWRTYHSKGDPTYECIGDNKMELCIKGYPDLPESYNELIPGYVEYLLERTGVKNVNGNFNQRTADFIKWTFVWD